MRTTAAANASMIVKPCSAASRLRASFALAARAKIGKSRCPVVRWIVVLTGVGRRQLGPAAPPLWVGGRIG